MSVPRKIIFYETSFNSLFRSSTSPIEINGEGESFSTKVLSSSNLRERESYSPVKIETISDLQV